MSFRLYLRFSIAIGFLLSSHQSLARNDSCVIFNVPKQEHAFVGRAKELEALKQMHSNNSLVAVIGLAGIGKTSFAKQYAIKYHEIYKVVWFVDARRDIETQLLEFAMELADKKLIDAHLSPHNVAEGAKASLNWLRSTDLAWLLIFDNVESPGELSSFLPETGNKTHKHILVTARRTLGWTNALRLPTFSDKESVTFLRNSLSESFTEEELVKLSATLGYHPRALLQASLHIARAPGMTCKKYVELFNSNIRRLTEEEKMIFSTQEASTELHTSLENLLDEINKTSPSSLPFLATLSLMSCSRIDEQLLVRCQDMLGHEGSRTFQHLIEPELLIKEGDHFQVHPYVATVVQNYLTETQMQQALSRGLKVLHSYIEHDTDKLVETFEKNPDLLNHIMEITKHINEATDISAELAVSALYYIYYFQRRYKTAWDLSQKTKVLIERNGTTPTSLAAGRSYSMYAPLAHLNNGSLEDSIEAALKGEAILDKIDTPLAREELVMLLSNTLASFYIFQGDTQKALKCVEKSEKILNNNPPMKNRLVILYVKILSATDLGDLDSARKYIEEQRETLRNQDMARFVEHITNLTAAKIEIKAGDIEKANDLASQAYEQALACSGNDEEHETVGRAGTMLACCELFNKNSKRALHLVDNAIKGFSDTYGKLKNRQQAYALMIKGDIQAESDKLEDALESYTMALSIYKTELTNMKIDDVSELYLRLVELGIKLGNGLLSKDYLEKHIETFGLKHSRSVQGMKKLRDAGIN